jgi:hypothetical protein
MFKTKFKVLLIFSLVLSVIFVSIININAGTEPSEDYRKLLDIQIFKDEPVVGWSGSGNGELETENDTLPVDTEITYNDLPSLRLNVTEEVTSWWWTSLLTVREWNTHDFTEYISNGYLEFNVIGEEGGEEFVIGARDKVSEREAGTEITITKNITDYCTITTEWQHVKIPLKDIMNPDEGFDTLNTLCLVLEKVDINPFTVWLNDIKITSTDNEKSAPAIKVNQLGFKSDSEKYALVTGFPEELNSKRGTAFYVKNSETDETVYTGSLDFLSDFEAVDSGEKILKANFKAVTEPGKYYITIDDENIEPSLEFEINDDIYSSLLVDSSRYFYYQRQDELTEPYAEGFARDNMTPTETEAVFASDTHYPIDLSSGWYDAGDYGKYVNAAATGLSDLFWAYEMFPEQFTDGQMNIPESDNDIPDILDEAKFELDWMLKMQDSESGGFYPRVQLNGDVREIKDQNGCTTDDTACAAAVLSHAYIIYKDIDNNFAEKCLESAESAFVFLENNTDNIASPSGPYTVETDKADRLWAAATLFRATSKDNYHEYFKDNYKEFESLFEDDYSYAHSWGNMWFTAYLSYLKSDTKDNNIVNWIDTKFEVWLNTITKRFENNPWGNAVVQGNYFWGINMQILNVPMDAYIGSVLLGKHSDRIDNMGFSSLNWILGTNPLRYSFVSGCGEDSVENVHSSIYQNDGKHEIPDGYMAGGPNCYQGEGLSNFAAKCYTKSPGDWVSNEHTIYWNSALVFMSAFANQ